MFGMRTGRHLRYLVDAFRASCTVLLIAIAGTAIAFAESTGPPAKDQTISFLNDVVPLLTKSGCNAGVCHAKAGGGQNGFQLSLLGFEPDEDFRHIVLEARGRRVFTPAAKQSLLLQKASGELPHGGGVRLPTDSAGYQTLLSWIQQGANRSVEGDPELKSITVEPADGILAKGEQQQLKTIAQFSDGTSRDVTPLALYESNDTAMAAVDEAGLVTAEDIPGKVAVMVRYRDKVSVYTGAIPQNIILSNTEVISYPKANNFVDEHLFANLKRIRIPASEVCDDATFLRRVSLDIGGRVPTETEVQEFLTDSSPQKRSDAIERLLRSPDYADYFASKWAAILKNRRDAASDITSNFAFHAWIRDNLLAGTPYDQIVRELLAATGTIVSNPPVAWYKRVKEPKEQIEDVAQLFLGVRMQCAQCHHHPFERWSQTDYFSLTAFFSQVGRKPTDTAGEDLIFHNRGIAKATHMKSGASVKPAALGDDVGEIPPDEDPRLRLANWMADPSNPFFAKALVNRYWKHFFSRGLVEPEDDIRDTNPPTNPELLAALENHFVDSQFDLKELVRVITNSTAYQLSSIPTDANQVDRQNYSRYYPKRLQAEVMLDAIDQVTGATTSFANLPMGTRAVSLPDNSYNKASPFLRVFGRPEAASVCECERVQSGSLSQSLYLMNAPDIKKKLNSARATELSNNADLKPDQKIHQIYLAAYGREPNPQELSIAVDYISEARTTADGKSMNTKQAQRENLQDLIWALINTKEFMFNH